jgi:hypothetical protein
MIGVICEDRQKSVVVEFFELFKVPWEFYSSDRDYDVVIVTGYTDTVRPTRLLIEFGPERKPADADQVTQINPGARGVLLEHHGHQFPVYLMTAIFDSSSKPLMRISGSTAVVGIEYFSQGQRVLRIGYDLFDEARFLLSQGQPIERAGIPTLDVHITMLRDWILGSGIPLLEVPPVPAGYNFVACLTHNVDFIGIRNHGLDHSVLGFIVRALLPQNLRNIASKTWWARLLRNWKALLSLPGVYLGLTWDIWFAIDRYTELESDISSTFFFVPFRDNPGHGPNGERPRYRAARYDVWHHRSLIDDLKTKGFEIKLHGIDAWHNLDIGLQEAKVIRELTHDDHIGVRMHWLYFSNESPEILEKTGVIYDSILGYNETVGYRSGTTQVYRLPGTSHLYELQLNIMDTTLFYPKRMGLSEPETLDVCTRLIGDTWTYGGVLTVNWHTRNLSPERNWDKFCVELLNMLRNQNVWPATCADAVRWFRKRRAIRFDDVRFSSSGVDAKLSLGDNDELPGAILRLYYPGRGAMKAAHTPCSEHRFVDIPWSGEREVHYVAPSLCGGNVAESS